MLHIYKY